jgi:DNA (cytosine-5)-methyltransferase 1
MAGFRELLAVEWDANAVETLRLNFPGMPIYHGDIAKLSVEGCLKLAGIAPGELDVLDGSPPCQGFSTAGKRVLDDPRNSLFKEYVRLLRGLRPKAFVMENVSGMVKGKMKLVFAEILRELKASGYKVKARLLNAMYYGVPQSRQRMIFVGVREDVAGEPGHPKAESQPIPISAAMVGSPSSAPRAMSTRAAAIWSRLRPGRGGQDVSGPNKDFSLVRLSPSMVCPTIRKAQSAGNGLMHWSERRYLSTSEMARLGSFPDAFLWAGSAQDAMQRIGNSVPPFLARAVARHVRSEMLHPRLSADAGRGAA